MSGSKAYSPRVPTIRPFLFLILVAGALLSGCATGKRSLRLQARDDLVQGRPKEAERKLTSGEVVSESKSRLLTLVELGTVAHISHEYEKSNEFFDRARKMAEELYTKSISESAQSYVVNDTSATYPGMDYEVSMIHYYLVLNNLLIAQEGQIPAWVMPEIRDGSQLVYQAREVPGRSLSEKEIGTYFTRARAEVLGWDTYLESVRQQSAGKAGYKDDEIAKLLGAYVHRTIGTVEDQGIARVLYQDANELLVRSYGAFPTFNQSYKKFLSGYSQFANIPVETVKSEFIQPTEAYQRLGTYIAESSRNVKSSKNNTLVVLELGTAPEKIEKKYTIGLSTLFGSIENPRTRRAVEEIGLRVLIQFAPKIGIGLVATAIAGAATSGDDQPDSLSGAMDKVIGFEFKLPSIPEVPTHSSYQLVFTGENGKSIEIPTAVVSPISDFAAREVEQKASSVALKMGVRTGTKYLAAMLTAYQVYKNLANKSEFLAVAAASATWLASKKLVEASESADIRAWNTLPQAVALGEGSLPPGKYEVSAHEMANLATVPIQLGVFTVLPGRKNLWKGRLFDIRNLTSPKLVSHVQLH